MPAEVRRRFIAARNVYYFLGGGRAFMDRGEQLTTRSENTQVIQSLVAIAQARGWNEITLSGTERFQRQTWLAARLADLTVRNYRPDAHTMAQLERERARRVRRASPASLETNPTTPTASRVSDVESRTPASTRTPREWRGRLLDHGAAPYQHEPANSMSYFVKLQTPVGERTVWGVDLKRAMQVASSRPGPGDEVVLHRVGHEDGTAHAVSSHRSGSLIDETSRPAPRPMQRHRYVIETREFWDARAGIARLVRDASVSPRVATHRHPELIGTYLTLRAAALTAHRLSHEEDRRTFVHLVRGAMADSIARGDAFRDIHLRARVGVRESHRERPVPSVGPSAGPMRG